MLVEVGVTDANSSTQNRFVLPNVQPNRGGAKKIQQVRIPESSPGYLLSKRASGSGRVRQTQGMGPASPIPMCSARRVECLPSSLAIMLQSALAG